MAVSQIRLMSVGCVALSTDLAEWRVVALFQCPRCIPADVVRGRRPSAMTRHCDDDDWQMTSRAGCRRNVDLCQSSASPQLSLFPAQLYDTLKDINCLNVCRGPPDMGWLPTSVCPPVLLSVPWETSSSAVGKRPRDASCLSVVSFNSTKRRAESFIVSYMATELSLRAIKCRSVVLGVTLRLPVVKFRSRLPPSTNSAA